jgi:DNA-binding NarL/FixJ family response regulator
MSASPKRPQSGPKQRILLVDDHPIVREGFTELINRDPHLEVCCQASTAAKAMGVAVRMNPDLVIVDLSLQEGSGLDLIKDLKVVKPKQSILVLSMHDESIYAERALRAGALGYVMKSETSATVLAAIHAVLLGKVFVSEAMRGHMLHQLVGHVRPTNPSVTALLSDRELEIFEMLGEGHTTRQIAKHLHLGVSTVETHRAHLKEKLMLRNAAELMRAAVHFVNQP